MAKVQGLKATKEQIIDDLNDVMTPLQRRMMKELLSHLDDEIDNFMKPEEKQASQAIQDVTGIGNTSAQAIISVIGTDMERFPTDRHISSWAGLCPSDNESAKKRKSGKTRKGNSLLRTTLITCSHAAVKNTKSYLNFQPKVALKAFWIGNLYIHSSLDLFSSHPDVMLFRIFKCGL